MPAPARIVPWHNLKNRQAARRAPNTRKTVIGRQGSYFRLKAKFILNKFSKTSLQARQSGTSYPTRTENLPDRAILSRTEAPCLLVRAFLHKGQPDKDRPAGIFPSCKIPSSLPGTNLPGNRKERNRPSRKPNKRLKTGSPKDRRPA